MSVQSWAVLSGRLQGIGASTTELAAIQAAYFGMTAQEQAALDTLTTSLDSAGLLVMLTTWRTSGAPFHAGFPGGGLPFGTGVAVLTGNPADDAYAIAAGTGTRVSPGGLGGGFETTSHKDAANGYAGLDSGGLLKSAELPAGLERTASKDAANGYAGLDSAGLLKAAELPVAFTSLGNVATTATLDMAGSSTHTFTFTLTAPSCAIDVINAVAGSELIVIPIQDGTPPRMVTHPAVVAWTSTGAPTLSSNANAPDRFQYTVLTVDGSGNPTLIVGSFGFTSGVAPAPISSPVISGSPTGLPSPLDPPLPPAIT